MSTKLTEINETKNNAKKSLRGRMADGAPNPIDIHVGSRIYLRRNELKLSQEKLAALLGVTFQQIQKYERGMNRVGASRLWDISRALDVPVDYFYDEMPVEIMEQSPRWLVSDEEDKEIWGQDSQDNSGV